MVQAKEKKICVSVNTLRKIRVSRQGIFFLIFFYTDYMRQGC